MANLNNFETNDENPCEYYYLTSDLDISNENFNVIHINIRTVNSNLDEFLGYLNRINKDFHVIVLTETFLKCESDWIDIPGFNAFHSIRTIKDGGGCTILVDSSLESNTIPNFCIVDEVFESVAVEIKMNMSSHTVLGVYRPPLSSLSLFNSNFFSMLDIVTGHCIITGDFNVDICSNVFSSLATDFIDNFSCRGYVSLINIPTRRTDHSGTCLDHIYINSELSCVSGVIQTLISDHDAVFCSLPQSKPVINKLKRIKFRDNSISSLNAFKSKVSQDLSIFHVYDSFSIDDKMEIFLNIIQKAYDSTCKVKEKNISIKKQTTPWMTQNLLNCIQEKHRLYRLSVVSPVFKTEFLNYKKQLKKSIYIAKKQYYCNKLNSSVNDPKTTWKTLSNILRPNVDRPNVKLKINDDIISDPLNVSKLFNEYFSSIADTLANNIPPSSSNPIENTNRLQNTFGFLPTDCNEVKNVIISFKSKKSRLNEIPIYAFKYIVDIITPVLASLFNESVTNGIFPACLKVARVVPIHKSGTKTEIKNYRPISTLPFIGKLFERLIHSRLYSFFDKYEVFYENQYGFLKNKSTTDAILRFVDQCYSNFDNKTHLISIFLDFSKAFDTVDHEILFKKLECYGIRGHVLNWIRSYLSDRFQYVEISGIKSPISRVDKGVPQGSIWGPFSLFCISMT